MGNDARQEFANFYKCITCAVEWVDIWSSTCDDVCFRCGAAISPSMSMDADQFDRKFLGQLDDIDQYEQFYNLRTVAVNGTITDHYRPTGGKS